MQPQGNVQYDSILAVSSGRIDPCEPPFAARNLQGSWSGLQCKQMVQNFSFVFTEEGFRVNTQVYLNILEERELLWVTESFQNDYVFIQDGAQFQNSEATRQR